MKSVGENKCLLLNCSKQGVRQREGTCLGGQVVVSFVCVCVPGPGIAINSISVSSSFCATGSEDGFLRLWPLDFSSVFLEAGEHSVAWRNI